MDTFWSLFALPSPKERWLPKCKSQNSRSAAYDLLIELVKGSVENYSILHEKVVAQHHKGEQHSNYKMTCFIFRNECLPHIPTLLLNISDSHLPYSWDNWPHEEERSKCGYVGLTNLGATCYMATCMQHLYMIPEARNAVLDAKVRNKFTKILQ